jgi:hypothetical protein
MGSIFSLSSILYLGCYKTIRFYAQFVDKYRCNNQKFIFIHIDYDSQIINGVKHVGGKSIETSSLAEVLDRILEKGIVIDIFVRVSIVGIELVTIEARVVIASIEQYLVYADAVGLTAGANQSLME